MPSRPRDKLAPECAAGLPLSGRDALSHDDVAAMIRPDFHDEPRFVNDAAARARFASRGAALVAVPGLAGLRDVAIATLRLDDYDPEAAMLFAKIRTRELGLPVTPALKWVLDNWVENHRPTDKGDALFPSEFGDPCPSSIGQYLRHLGWRLGAERQLSTMLFEYHRANLGGVSAGAYRAYFGIRTSRKGPAPKTGETIRKLVEMADPFGEDIGFLTRPHRAFAIGGADTMVPGAAHVLSEARYGKRLAKDSPLARALAKANVTGIAARQKELAHLFEQHGADIDRAAIDGVSLSSMVELCGGAFKTFKGRLAAWRTKAPPRSRKLRAAPPARSAPTTAESKRLASIASTRWPRGRVAVDLRRRELLANEFPFVRELLRGRKITYKAARRLFRLSAKQITLRLFDLDNGLFHLATGPRTGPADRRIVQALAIREYAAAPGQSLTALWKRLRLTYAYPLDYPALVAIVLSYRTGRYKLRAGVPAPPPAAAAA